MELCALVFMFEFNVIVWFVCALVCDGVWCVCAYVCAFLCGVCAVCFAVCEYVYVRLGCIV